MQRYRIILLVPTAREIVAVDAQAAHNEATKLAQAETWEQMKPIIHSVEYLGDVKTEEITYE